MHREAPLAGGAVAPTLEEQPANPKSTPHEARHSSTPTSATLTQPSCSGSTPHGHSSDKGKGPSTSEKRNPSTGQFEGKKPPSTQSSKRTKASASSSKKSQTKQSRKPDANKVAGLQKRKRSIAWDHFKMVPEEEVSHPTAECIHCGHRFLCGTKEHGTSNLLAHIKKCPKLNVTTDPSQKLLNFEGMSSGRQLAGSVPQTVDMKECRKALSVFMICDEQPFRVVEGFGFNYLCKRLCPRFQMPSRRTLTRDCFQLFLEERDRVRSLLQSDCERVCLTTDCWTSLQNLNYMSLTAHFIDNDWNYQKRILNFCLVPNHKGETIGKAIEACLNEWGLRKVFTVTVDNASANDSAIAYLKKKVGNWNGLVMNGDTLHMRCCAHILNLVVSEGLKEYHESISSIRNAVRYVRSSPSRLARFKDTIAAENLSNKRLVCLDVATRWNSTYKMLDSAVDFQKAFERLEEEDRDFQLYFLESEKRGSPPTTQDWNNARTFVQFLKIFYDVTLALSGSLHVTSSSAYIHISLVQSELKKWTSAEQEDSLLYFMATEMRMKFDKYWGMVENMNPIIFVANALDPRFKLAYIAWSFEEIYGEMLADALVTKVKAILGRLYAWYAVEYGKPECGGESALNQGGSSSGREVVVESHAQKARTAAFRSHLKKKDTIQAKNELERYLNEPCEEDTKFDLMGWWRSNASRFEVLSKMARDVLAVPVSTVASESAFSTGGRVLDAFRSSLSPKTVEALICTQNWLKPSDTEFHRYEEPDPIEVYEEIETEVVTAQGVGRGRPSTASTTGQGEDTQPPPQPMAVD